MQVFSCKRWWSLLVVTLTTRKYPYICLLQTSNQPHELIFHHLFRYSPTGILPTFKADLSHSKSWERHRMKFAEMFAITKRMMYCFQWVCWLVNLLLYTFALDRNLCIKFNYERAFVCTKFQLALHCHLIYASRSNWCCFLYSHTYAHIECINAIPFPLSATADHLRAGNNRTIEIGRRTLRARLLKHVSWWSVLGEVSMGRSRFIWHHVTSATPSSHVKWGERDSLMNTIYPPQARGVGPFVGFVFARVV